MNFVPRLPSPQSPAFEHVDPAQIAEICGSTEQLRRLDTYRDGIRRAQDYLGRDTAARSVQWLVLRGDGELWLLCVKRTSAVRLWNFGKVCP